MFDPIKTAPPRPGASSPASFLMDLPEEVAWQAVVSRNRRYDGMFVYAVATTGIYCRPSCPSRRPHRENVVFLPSPEAAQRAGYRACRRCRPDDAAGTPAEQAVEQARAYLDAHLDETVTLEALSEVAGLSTYHLQRTFKRLVGLSPKAYQDARRLEAFKEQAQDGGTVLEATFAAGYGSSRALYNQAEAALGMTPGAYRRGGEGLHIRYAMMPSAYGRLLVAATERGVCAVALGDDDATLAADLEAEFQNAEVEYDAEAVGRWAGPIVRYLEGVHAHPAVPVLLEGTDFQRRVWRALQEIPYGETRTYAEVAEMIGRPSASRAVAQACAANKLALVVPCHRVVPKGAGTGGYRWGKDRKQRLLELELNSQ